MPKNLKHEDLLEDLIRIAELPRAEAMAVVEAIFASVVEGLQNNDEVTILGFGSFRIRRRRGRIGHNPRTKAKVEVPQKRIAYFRPGLELERIAEAQCE